MKRKQVLVFQQFAFWALIPLIICSCIQRLTFYQKDYKPNLNSELRFDGYYNSNSSKKSSSRNNTVSNTNGQKHFYQDGLVAYHINFGAKPHKEMCTADNSVKVAKQKVDWGAYKVSGDTLTVEVLAPHFDDFLFTINRTTNEFKIIKDGLILFATDNPNSRKSDTLYFHPYPYKPDSTYCFFKKMRRYNK